MAAPIFLLLAVPIIAQQPKLSFTHITPEQGLSNSTIETIFQDSRGFMWFGTRDGLNRYDGYEMVVYKNEPGNTNSISDSYIRCIYEDGQHKLWVGTSNGLNLFDPATNRFTRFMKSANVAGNLNNNDIYSITGQADGTIWIATSGGGINLFHRNSGLFTVLRSKQSAGSLSNDKVNCLLKDKSGTIWAGTDNGLNRFDNQSKTFEIYYPADLKDSSHANIIKTVQEDANGNLWLGTLDDGLYLFNPKQKTFTHYRHNETDAASLASDQIRTILVDKAGKLWVGGINGGLNLFNRGQSFYHYQTEPANPKSLSQKTISSLFEDMQGNLWVGTHRGGINFYAPDTDKFKLFKQEIETTSLSYNDVSSFYEDVEGKIWVGTDGGGLNLYNPVTYIFTHYRHDANNSKSIGSDAVLDITGDAKGNLWIGTWGGGLNLMDKKSGTFKRFVNNPADKNSISSNYIQKIIAEENGNLWVATYYGGLNYYDQATKKFIRIQQSPNGSTVLSGNNIVSLIKDKDNNIRMGTDDGGLNCLNYQTQQFIHYFQNPDTKPNLRVIFNDSKNRLWVGQAGLYLLDKKADSFKIYTEKAGLSSETIKGITEDDKQNLWISTSKGIIKFNPETFQFKKFNTADGLQGSEFEANAFLKTKNGEMYFGGINGFNSFFPDSIKANKFIPPVYLTGFQIFNDKIVAGQDGSPLKTDISETKEIRLSYFQSGFTFSFAALNYNASQNNQYAYKLDGLDPDWNYVGNQRKASYTNVNPGSYTFHVKASNNDGIWNGLETTVKIIIAPPFWETWWFLFLLTGFIIWVVFYLLYRRRKFELNRMEEKKEAEMQQVQLQFFTNISHELRTPLSLILGPIEKLKQYHSDPAITHYYQSIHRNSLRMVTLINELMDFRKVESGVLKLKVAKQNLNSFVQEIAEEFEDLSIHKRIEYVVKPSLTIKEAWFDKQVLEKIILNLLNNSFKYTDDGGKIEVEILNSLDDYQPSFKNELVLTSAHRSQNYFYIKVKDNGIGISSESIKHLFERYYRISRQHLGSGIGLAFVKSLTELHNGDVYVYSERHEGTEIIIGIPCEEKNYGDEEKRVENDTPGMISLESIDYDMMPDIQNPAAAASENQKNTEHILLVEDNDELRAFIKSVLSPHYTISEAANGVIGLEQVKKVFPTLIISDVMMPEMDGVEFCKAIKENIETSHIPFIMLTAKDAIESKITGVKSGADHYFSKPISTDLLLLTIKNIFSQIQKSKERYAQDYHSEARDLVHSVQDKTFMDNLLSIIEEKMVDPEFDVDALCTEIGMSRTKLYEKIKQVTGQNIVEFIRTVRLRKAVYIMTHEDVPIADIIFRIGIQTQSYFTKAFKKEFGKTPTQFLQELERK